MGSYYLGIDIGSVSIKIALLAHLDQRPVLSAVFKEQENEFAFFEEIVTNKNQHYLLLLSRYRRIKGEPFRIAFQLLKQFIHKFSSQDNLTIVLTGIGGKTFARIIGAPFVNEFQAIAIGVGTLNPQTKTILEIGGDSSKYMKLEVDRSSGFIGIVDYEKNGDCAAGTGSFMDQQALRLLYQIEDVGNVVLQADRAAAIAGRCSVFAKSDMIHAQQKGFKPPEILKGLCEAVIRNFKGTITKGKEIVPPVAFIGGVASNNGIVQVIRTMFQLKDHELFVPPFHLWLGAIGCALIAVEKEQRMKVDELLSKNIDQKKAYTTSQAIATTNLMILRDRVRPYILDEQRLVRCYLGLDIGSVTTKLVLIDENDVLIYEVYTRTQARPIEVVRQNLKEIAAKLGARIEIIGVGTTGSGRELIGELIGADVIKDEITAHKTGAMNVSEKLTGKNVDTIFDIGGQDSKYISIENGIVVDFAMNEACAAGTGSFLEEQAEKLGIQIKDEFAELALQSEHPIRMGERCTVFMEKDITAYLQQGASKKEIAAGLAYSIVWNYLNRVVRGRKIGDVIYFQGGTAYNDAVAAAFATVLNKQIIVPPHNGVIGAIGAALLAKQKIKATGLTTKFRGYDLDQIDYHIRNFTCNGCTNFCDIQEFIVEGQKTYWGDKCAEKYRKAVKLKRQPLIPDLFDFRKKLFFDGYDDQANGKPIVGMARSIYFHDRFPFWNAYFHQLGVKLVLSDETNKRVINAGVECQVAEPCFPIAVAHGHFENLMNKGVDFIFQPNAINAETNFPQTNSYLCPWGQTLCFVFKHTPLFHAYEERLLFPNIRFGEGSAVVELALRPVAKKLGCSIKTHEKAVIVAFRAQQEFQKKLLEKGRTVLDQLRKMGTRAIILLGRPYNIYDPMVNLGIARKLRENYGINIIPLDFLSGDDLNIYDVTENMFWNYGRKILQVAKSTRDLPNLHLIYITNFKCGPDSYIKHYVRDACRKPFLTLQFDGHGNDAGIITRCEAYLDSKGFL